MVNPVRNRTEGLDAQRIEKCLTDIRGRMYRQALLQTIVSTLFCGLVLLVMLFFLNRVIPLPIRMLTVSWIIIFVATVVGICLSVKHRKNLHFIARTVDEKIELRERLSTAFGLMQTNPKNAFAQLQIRDAAETTITLDIKKVSPYRLPKLLKLFPIPLLLIALSFTVSPFYEVPQPLTDSQQQVLNRAIQDLEGRHVKDSTLQTQISDTVKDLKAASEINTAQKHLSELKKEIRKQQAEQTTITEATEVSPSFHSMDAHQLAAELETLTEQAEIPPELQAELMRLFERLAEGLPKGELNDSLNKIQGQAVTPETLQDIIAALEKIEKSTDLAQLEAQLTASQKDLALATLDTESAGGGIANSDGAPGRDIGTHAVQGTREGPSNSNLPSELRTADAGKVESETGTEDATVPLIGEKTPTLQGNGEQLILTTATSGNAEGASRVFTGEVSDDTPDYLPFADVVLNASRAYAEAVENNHIPVRYQAQIKSYLEAISKK
ncbi:hypothetical protein F4X10_00970 [Candidatus Poribacteria bacterium]|nr:hypothetical protein [Candidatus Poribacteria bacterium]